MIEFELATPQRRQDLEMTFAPSSVGAEDIKLEYLELPGADVLW